MHPGVDEARALHASLINNEPSDLRDLLLVYIRMTHMTYGYFLCGDLHQWLCTHGVMSRLYHPGIRRRVSIGDLNTPFTRTSPPWAHL